MTQSFPGEATRKSAEVSILLESPRQSSICSLIDLYKVLENLEMFL